ncbi:hypothetical protein BB561_006419 [Smittium simulii]|uniref:Uncharacterized protein n=1 Tax=Smittium simulii TaxID=133385 RepID=A0A2T9Y4F8_9FUNG|nr:hypothetical protein BB561_006419 [Smittium simulii]
MSSNYKPEADQDNKIETAQLRPETLANINKDKDKIVERISKNVIEVTYLVGQKVYK